METIKFKTTIKCSGCVAKASPFLTEAFGDNWEVDIDNPAKVLTVTGENDHAKVIQTVEKAGYKAETL